MSVPVAYQGNTSLAVADWLNKGDNAWQMVSATLVGLQSVPGLVILYGSIVKKKWAVNSAFMALYAFAAVWICWVTWAYNMSFGDKLLPFWGLVQGWAAMVMGVLSGSVPWFTMMIVHKRSRLLQHVDDTLGVFHTHAVAGFLGGALTSLFAEPALCALFLPVTNSRGGFYGGVGGVQFAKQIVGALFVIGWNPVATTIICLVVKLIVPLRMSEEQLIIGDDAVHGEEAYALWGDEEKYNSTRHGFYDADDTQHNNNQAATGVTQNV